MVFQGSVLMTPDRFYLSSFTDVGFKRAPERDLKTQ